MNNTNFREMAAEELLAVLPQDRAAQLAFLSAVAKITGTVELQKKRVNLVLVLDSYPHALCVVDIFKAHYPAEFEVSPLKEKSKKHGAEGYNVIVPTGFTKQILTDLCLMSLDDESYSAFCEGVPQMLTTSNSGAIAYLKGLFFACGSIYVPSISGDEKKDGYHLEFQFDDGDEAESVQHFLLNFDIASKINARGTHFLVYMKDKDEILKLLTLLGLVECGLQLRAIINERETANCMNRAVICETANLDKTFTAASKQLLAIGEIDAHGGLDSLQPTLKETAIARMENPQATLQELSEIMNISKSCLNHRLRKLIELGGVEGEENSNYTIRNIITTRHRR